jgi:isopenicillin-N epimerase
MEEQQYQGTRDMSAYLSVPVAIDFMERHDWQAVRARCRDLICYARQEIGAMTGLPQFCPDSPAWFSQISTITLPKGDISALGAEFGARHIEIPITGWHEDRALRLSVQGYNSKADVDTLIDAVRTWLAKAAPATPPVAG